MTDCTWMEAFTEVLVTTLYCWVIGTPGTTSVLLWDHRKPQHGPFKTPGCDIELWECLPSLLTQLAVFTDLWITTLFSPTVKKVSTTTYSKVLRVQAVSLHVFLGGLHKTLSATFLILVETATFFFYNYNDSSGSCCGLLPSAYYCTACLVLIKVCCRFGAKPN